MTQQTTRAIVTQVGKNKIAGALDPNNPAFLSGWTVGLGSGGTPHAGAETALYQEFLRRPLSRGGKVSGAPNTVYFDLDLSTTDGPYTITEAGVFDEDNDLIVVAYYDPPIIKTTPDSGQAQSGTIRINAAVEDASVIRFDVNETAFVLQNHTITTQEITGLFGGGDSSEDRDHYITQASTTQRGTTKIANNPRDRTDSTSIITPEHLHQIIGLEDDGTPLHLELWNQGETLQSIPEFTQTRCNNMVPRSGNAASRWNGHRFTVDADSLGVYGVLNRLNTNGETGEGASTWKNDINVRNYQLSNQAGAAHVFPFTHFVNMLTVGDYIEFYHYHQSTQSRQNGNSEAQIYRLITYVDPNA